MAGKAVGRASSNITYYLKPYIPIKVLPPETGIKEYFRRWYFLKEGYNQLGLYHDDVMYEWPEVAEAVRRLPAELKIERDWRTLRAIQLDIKNIILPEDQWTQYDDDITKGRYLQPYLQEVIREIKERNEWEALH